ncbi:citrate transporter [Schizosaccharomyces japonicus yFS275]|uniref:Citrate transporter n=1 Tax=Schizosaccharomyces japonicus (strain yFS275 / FY16936) TaxID=402676 RepID=B6JZ48_SCHJY|nr:citrate transporter [Schizosaccharomyces japonicus yFS275]EEB06816.1 citrate transporter [Schizosaccharomyces japonicus yFS275]
MQRSQKRREPGPLQKILAGVTAGAFEVSITYPAEFAKTRLQLYERAEGAAAKLPPFGLQWYRGYTSLFIGNVVRAGFRFLAFDGILRLLNPPNSRPTGPRTVAAGLGAGIIESVFLITPFEVVKTAVIDDGKQVPSKQRLGSFMHAIKTISRDGGLKALYRGFGPTIVRQAGNSAIRFSTYTGLKQALQGHLTPGEKLSTKTTISIGCISGAVTIFCTQPIDTVKTRMQSCSAKYRYKNSIHCAYKLYKQDGIRQLWAGTLPRLVRLTLSGGIVFAVYEKCVDFF